MPGPGAGVERGEDDAAVDANGNGGAARTKDRRRPRRASLPAPEGSDPEPQDPPTERRADGENDARLAQDRPPHWG